MKPLAPFLIATSNPGKAHELSSALADLPLEFLSLADLPVEFRATEPEESGATFAENAKIKAEFWYEKTSLSTLADDSGIIVDALPDELGVHTVRFGAGKKASDAEWLKYFLERLKNVPPEKRGAEFVCVLALTNLRPTTNNQQLPTIFFAGKTRGTIMIAPEAPIQKGIPLSSVFKPLGAEKVFSALTTAEKAEFSHRGRALAELKQYLIQDREN